VYHFENEQLLEAINRAALSTLVETADAYRFYFGVYVRNVGGSRRAARIILLYSITEPYGCTTAWLESASSLKLRPSLAQKLL
jgi:hypothetical protein